MRSGCHKQDEQSEQAEKQRYSPFSNVIKKLVYCQSRLRGQNSVEQSRDSGATRNF